MSDVPERPGGDDPFEHLPPELRQLFEQLPPEMKELFAQLADPEAMEDLQQQLSGLLGNLGEAGAGGLAGLSGLEGGLGGLFGPGGMPGAGGAPSGPVDWSLATRVALQVAADGDRAPTDDERERAQQALQLAEHWLDGTPLPAAPDAGRLVVDSRQTWVNAALVTLRPLVEPVARASTDALVDIARDQFEQLSELDDVTDLPGMEGLPPGFAEIAAQMMSGDPGAMLRPAGAMMAGLQAGQIIGQLASQLLGQYELGIPTAPRAEAYHLAVNVADAFEGYDLDPVEVDLVLTLHEVAHRRLYHAVPWLEAHVQSLVTRFAAGTTVDESRLRELSEELMVGLDPEDPESLRSAMERAANLRLRPTEEQQRVLERLQAVVCLIGAWARHEVARAVDGRLPSLDRIGEVLRRRRATKGDGEELLTALLGLDIKPDDESVGERFVQAVEDVLGPAGLHRALAHPENLPDSTELANPGTWLARTADDLDLPDDASALFGELGEAPREASADERTSRPPGQPDDPDGGPSDGDSGSEGPGGDGPPDAGRG